MCVCVCVCVCACACVCMRLCVLGIYVDAMSPDFHFTQFQTFSTHSSFCASPTSVQVSTRFIAASSPVVYWLLAEWMAPLLSEGRSDNDGRKDHTSGKNITLYTLFNTAIRMPSKGTWESYRLLLCRTVLLYFISYNVVGFTLHCNFYPWT